MRSSTLLLCFALAAAPLVGCGINERVAASSGACGDPPAEPGPDGCALVCRGSIPVRFDGDAPMVTVWINDKPVELMLDTGADGTALTRATAASLGLPEPRAAEGTMNGIGGSQPRRVVDIADLAVGGIRTGARSIDVSEFGKSQHVFTGALGADILHKYEVDLDFPHGAVHLYEGKACPGPPPGWANAGFVVPFGSGYWGHQAVVPVQLDGQPVQAVVDSGAGRSTVNDAFARRLQVPEAELNSELSTVSVGFGPALGQGRLHQFRSLQIGPETVPLFEANVIDLRSRRINMLLGDDYLRARKVWISFARRQITIASDW